MPHPPSSASLACGLLLPVLIGLAGCQRTDTVAGNVPGNDVIRFDRNGDRVPHPETAAHAIHASDTLALPADFPDDVYLPARYVIDSVMDTPGMQVVNLRAPGRVSGLSTDAGQAMARAGWTRRMAVQHSVDNAVLAFEKERRGALLAFNRNVSADGASDAGMVVSVQLEERAVPAR